MAERNVTVRISATDNFSDVLKKYNAAMKDAGESTKRFEQDSKNTGGGLKSLNDNLFVMKASFEAVRQAFQWGVDLVNLGRQVNAVEATFTQLSGGASAATAQLALMRQATNGIVTDMQLMQAANQFMQMQLSNSADETARLTELAIKLGGAMGHGAEESIQSFSMMLANSSIPRLDLFGLSSGRVRMRINELLESGEALNRSDAFKMATLEEGAAALERLGSAANTSTTALSRAETAFSNFMAQVGQNVAQSVEGGLGILEVMLGVNPQQQNMSTGGKLQSQGAAFSALGELPVIGGMFGVMGGVLQDQAEQMLQAEQSQGFIDNYWGEFGRLWQEGSGILVGSASAGLQDTLRQAVGDGYNALMADPTLARRPEELMQLFTAVPTDLRRGFTDALIATFDLSEVESKLQERYQRLSNTMAVAGESAANDAIPTLGEALPGAIEAYGMGVAARQQQAYWGAVTDFYGGMAVPTDPLAQARAAGQSLQSQGRERAIGTLGAFTTTAEGFVTEGAPEFATRDQAAQAQAEYEAIAQEFERIQRLADAGLITDNELNKAASLADEAARTAQGFDDAAAALENLSLSEVFGQTGGGMAGEISDIVVSQMQASGASEEEIAAFQQQADLASGRESAASVAMEEQVAPIIAGIADSLGGDAAIQAMQNVEAFLKQAALLELSQEQIAAGLVGATGFMGGGEGQTFTVGAGDTLSGIAAQMGVPVNQLLAATGAGSAGLVQPGQYSLGGGFQPNVGFDPMAYAQMIAGGGEGTYGMMGQTGIGGGRKPGYGYTEEDLAALAGGGEGGDPFAAAAEGISAAAEGSQTLVDNFSMAKSNVEELVTSLGTIPSRKQVAIDLIVSNPNLMAILNGALGGAVASVTTSNGGVPPGIPGRPGRTD